MVSHTLVIFFQNKIWYLLTLAKYIEKLCTFELQIFLRQMTSMTDNLAFTRKGQLLHLIFQHRMGYDINRFQGDVDEELICPICSGVLEDPLQVEYIHDFFHYRMSKLSWSHQCKSGFERNEFVDFTTLLLLKAPQCEHAFCSGCIHEWLTRQPSCPVDRNNITPNQLKPVPRITRNLLSRLYISCDNASFGCTGKIVHVELLADQKSKENAFTTCWCKVDDQICFPTIVGVKTNSKSRNEFFFAEDVDIVRNPNNVLILSFFQL